MRYLSLCSGIEAASVAWHHLGWTPVAFSEIEPFPSAVLAHRFPDIPNLGDMTKHEQWTIERGSVDVLVGGTPCQSFSVAGLRKGISDARGGLMLTYLEIARRLRPRWIVWENVPGVLSSNGGRDFGTFLWALGELGYGWAYRVLDAQYVRVGKWPRAVPQRRRRVFVVGCLGDWTAAAEVLAIREGLRRHLEASRKTRKGAAADAEGGARGGCWPARVSSTLNHAFGTKLGLEDQHALGGASMFVPRNGCWWDGSDCAGTLTKQNANGAQRMPDKDNFGAVLQPVASTLGNRGLRSHTEIDGHGAYITVAFQQNTRDEVSPAVKVGSGLGIPSPPAMAQAMTVRRLTPRECERLQGFPDDWTLIPWRGKPADECPDGPRYKALGNSMACNCMAWIGERINTKENT